VPDRPPNAITPPHETAHAAWPVKRVVTRPAPADGSGDEPAAAMPPPDDLVSPGAAAGAAAAEPAGASEPAEPAEGTLPRGLADGLAAGIREVSGAFAAGADAFARTLTGAPTDGEGTAIVEEIDPTVPRFRERKPGIVLDCGADNSVRHVGVVFVHGIGSQNAGEILLEWSGAIVRALAQLRLQAGAPVDPVVTTQLDPSGGRDLFIELAYPETLGPNGETVPAEHWVLSEAWWAQRVRPPEFGRMAEWLGPGGAVGRIITAMFAAQREGDPRQRTHAQAHRLARPESVDGDEAAELRTTEVGPALSMLERPIEPTRKPEADEQPPAGRAPATGRQDTVGRTSRPGPVAGLVEQLGVRAFLQAVATLVLLLYGALRSIEKVLPIGPLKDGALTRPIDRFVLDWFGDVYVLLGDPAQGESVRERLTDAIWNLEAIACEPIAIVAHSGGAIVTYQTLSDPATQRLRVDRVVTIGEAANLGWRLTRFGDTDDGQKASDVHGGLYRTLKNRLHPLVWTDFWASQDPAPVGLIRFPRVDLPDVESVGVWNRLSFREDHGGYWDNDEEFVVPLLRRLAGPGSGPDGARADFGTDAQHELRSRKRRERLTVLSFWTQFCRALPTAAVVHSYVVGAAGIAVASSIAAGIFGAIPGSDLITDPINALRDTYEDGFPPGFADFVSELGVRVIAVVLAATAIFALRAPPERSATFVRPAFVGFDIGYAVVWRGAVIYLVVEAAMRFLGASASFASINSAAIVLAVFGLALADVAVGRAMQGDTALSRGVARVTGGLTNARRGVKDSWARLPFGREAAYAVRVALTAVGLAIVALLVASPFVAMAVYEDVGATVLGTLAIFIAFQLLLAVGKWRWTRWDDRQRVETMRRDYRGGESVAVAIQFTIHVGAAILLYASVVWPNELVLGLNLIVWSLVLVAMAVAIGIGIDVTTTERRRAGKPSERVAELIRSKS
jgi:hypothetical protein